MMFGNRPRLETEQAKPNCVNSERIAWLSGPADQHIFALPGAFTPTCSAQHVPGFKAAFDEFKAAGVDEIWCLSVNDAYVMGAWARDQGTAGKIRMIADGSATFTQAAGLVFDLQAHGFGLRSQRYSMLVVDGVVKTLNVEAPGQFEVSDAATLLAQAKALRA